MRIEYLSKSEEVRGHRQHHILTNLGIREIKSYRVDSSSNGEGYRGRQKKETDTGRETERGREPNWIAR